jgi:XTP/dITP diphosphohydrolase
MLELLFGTTNAGKLRELRRLVSRLPVRVVSPEELAHPLPEVVEDGRTFAENAEKKAAAYALASGLHALADDSGLSVEALWGVPGVRSARWSEDEPGPELPRAARDAANNEKLLRALRGVPDEIRGAEYRAALALAAPGGRILATVVGACSGRIAQAPRGTGGFGYDPLFIPETELMRAQVRPDEVGPERAGEEGDQARRGAEARPGQTAAPGRLRPPRTMAELSPEEKDAISHRGDAMRRLLPALQELAATL